MRYFIQRLIRIVGESHRYTKGFAELSKLIEADSSTPKEGLVYFGKYAGGKNDGSHNLVLYSAHKDDANMIEIKPNADIVACIKRAAKKSDAPELTIFPLDDSALGELEKSLNGNLFDTPCKGGNCTICYKKEPLLLCAQSRQVPVENSECYTDKMQRLVE